VLLVAFVVRERRTPHPMLDVSLFRDRRFSAASGAVTVTFFALFGFIFLVTQYFQFVRGFGTLSTGARILPVALSIAVASVVGAALAPRIGTKIVVTTGMVLFGSAFLWISTSSVTTPYTTVIVPQMVMMGLGMGLISTPATESILLVLPPARAGVGSAVNDATRELGGTLGVAVVGSLFASLYADHLADGAFGRLPGAALAQAQDSVGAALAVSGGDPRLVVAMQDAFMSGLSVSCMVIGTLCLLGAVGALRFLPGRVPTEPQSEEPAPTVAVVPA
jgi:predicted MFS family arabinose efflux permease